GDSDQMQSENTLALEETSLSGPDGHAVLKNGKLPRNNRGELDIPHDPELHARFTHRFGNWSARSRQSHVLHDYMQLPVEDSVSTGVASSKVCCFWGVRLRPF